MPQTRRAHDAVKEDTYASSPYMRNVPQAETRAAKIPRWQHPGVNNVATTTTSTTTMTTTTPRSFRLRRAPAMPRTVCITRFPASLVSRNRNSVGNLGRRLLDDLVDVADFSAVILRPVEFLKVSKAKNQNFFYSCDK